MQRIATNSDIRNHTMDVVKQHWGKILLMTIIVAAIPSLILQVLSAIFNRILPVPLASVPMLLANPYYLRYYGSSVIVGYLLYLLVALVVSALVAPALQLGMNNGLLCLTRGENTSVEVVFSRLRSCLKAFLLTLFIGLRIWLWTLPGLAISTLGIIIGSGFGLFLTFVGFIAMYVLVIPAAFRYCMAIPALADQPELGVLDAFNKSKEIMDGRKWQYFKLMFLYGLILFGIVLAATLLAALLAKATVVLSILLIIPVIVACVFISMLIQVATMTFYNAYAGNNTASAPTSYDSTVSKDFFSPISYDPNAGSDFSSLTNDPFSNN